MEIKIDQKKCNLCKKCINVCPMNALKKSGNKIKVDFDHCTKCSLCIINCPEDAISLK